MNLFIDVFVRRRYGVAEGRFCFEGGSHCGKGEGLHLLITDQAQDITDAFDQAVHGNSIQQRSQGFKSNAGKVLHFFQFNNSR